MRLFLVLKLLCFAAFFASQTYGEVRSDYYHYYHPNNWDYGSNATPSTYYERGYRSGVSDSQYPSRYYIRSSSAPSYYSEPSYSPPVTHYYYYRRTYTYTRTIRVYEWP